MIGKHMDYPYSREQLIRALCSMYKISPDTLLGVGIENKITEKALLLGRNMLHESMFELPVKNWKWEMGNTITGYGIAYRLTRSPQPESVVHSSSVEWDRFFVAADRIIKEASIEECLTSPSEYIRECKKWFMENGQK